MKVIEMVAERERPYYAVLVLPTCCNTNERKKGFEILKISTAIELPEVSINRNTVYDTRHF